MSLSPSAMITYDSLVQDFTLDRIGVAEMTTSSGERRVSSSALP